MGNTVIWEAQPTSRGAPIREHGRLLWVPTGAKPEPRFWKGTMDPHRYDKQGQTGRSGLPPLLMLLRD